MQEMGVFAFDVECMIVCLWATLNKKQVISPNVPLMYLAPKAGDRRGMKDSSVRYQFINFPGGWGGNHGKMVSNPSEGSLMWELGGHLRLAAAKFFPEVWNPVYRHTQWAT